MILRHDRDDAECVVDEAAWPSVVSFFDGDGAATVIAARWVLTAAHTAANLPPRHRFRVGGREVGVRRALPHHTHGSKGSAPVDLALVELDAETDVAPLPLQSNGGETGEEALLLGRGDLGDGLVGARGTDQRLRCVTNVVESVDDRWLRFRFDPPPRATRLEGVCGEGDSGGPALVQFGHELRVVGVSSWQEHAGRLGTYGCVEHYARVAPHVEWIRRIAGI